MLIAENVKGYDQLPDKVKEMFRNFLKNFYNAWGLEARETIVPISVELKKDKASGVYLRFVYEIYDRKEWLHVKNPCTWY